MRKNLKGFAVLRAVASGDTIPAAATKVGISSGHARQLLIQACREIRMSSVVADIRREPNAYLAKLGEPVDDPFAGIRLDLVPKLAEACRVQASQLSPKYLTNITAEQLRSAGMTYVAIAEVQVWLVRHGASLKRRPPDGTESMAEVTRALALLDVFHFDTEKLWQQLAHLTAD